MSLRVVGYRDGHRIVVDEGESKARVQGFGGAAIGTWNARTVLTAKQRRRNEPRKHLARQTLASRRAGHVE